MKATVAWYSSILFENIDTDALPEEPEPESVRDPIGLERMKAYNDSFYNYPANPDEPEEEEAEESTDFFDSASGRSFLPPPNDARVMETGMSEF